MSRGAARESHEAVASAGAEERLAAPMPVTTIAFRTAPPGDLIDWHPAPRRRWVIILPGQLEIGLREGTLRRFGPGDARLVQDTRERGHTTRVVGDRPCLTAVIPLATDVSGSV